LSRDCATSRRASRSAYAWQISAMATKDYLRPDGIWVAPALVLLADLA